MQRIKGVVERLSKWADRLGAFCIAACMFLVVGNILLRTIIKKPILGTYEYVGLIIAVAIGLSLANCEQGDGNISLNVITEKLPPKIRFFVDLAGKLVSLLFIGISTFYVFRYAGLIYLSREVTPTTKTLFYPFIYMVAFGLLLLCLTIAVKIFKLFEKAVEK